MVTSLLSEVDARAVEAAVTRVEQGTSAELVVAVLPRSGEYWRGRLFVSVAWSLAAAWALLRFKPHQDPALALVLEVVVGVLVFLALGLRPLERSLLSRAEAQRAAHARAFQLFAERGLYTTRRHTALLIFVSELERQVVLLGDATIHAHLGQAGWDDQLRRLLERIRQGRLKDGLLEVIADLEPRLSAIAARGPDDTNELPDTVLRQ